MCSQTTVSAITAAHQEPVVSDDETDASYSEELCSEEEYERNFETCTIRAKWMLDGATTLDECIDKCNEFIQYIKDLKADGWTLDEGVGDDYGYMSRPRAPPLPDSLAHLTERGLVAPAASRPT